MDDGSRDTDESIAMLEALRSQGVDTVIATPHFYANDESVAEFLERREASYGKLMSACPENAPRIVKGAEVRYYPGISRMAELGKLRIEGSRLLLLEMSMTHWTEYTVKEIIELSSTKGIRLLLAHIERYMNMQNAKVWDRLYENGVLMQVNASFFTGFTTKRRALRLLDNGGIHFIGSDCHNMSTRPPRLCGAFEIIEDKLGGDFLNRMNEYGRSVLVKK